MHIYDVTNPQGLFCQSKLDVKYKQHLLFLKYIYIYNKLKCSEPTEMLLRQKDPKGFTVQASRSEFKTVIKNEDGQLRAKENIYIR